MTTTYGWAYVVVTLIWATRVWRALPPEQTPGYMPVFYSFIPGTNTTSTTSSPGVQWPEFHSVQRRARLGNGSRPGLPRCPAGGRRPASAPVSYVDTCSWHDPGRRPPPAEPPSVSRKARSAAKFMEAGSSAGRISSGGVNLGLTLSCRAAHRNRERRVNGGNGWYTGKP